jgi:hypothetical protein
MMPSKRAHRSSLIVTEGSGGFSMAINRCDGEVSQFHLQK